jgi:hypothetical protein
VTHQREGPAGQDGADSKSVGLERPHAIQNLRSLREKSTRDHTSAQDVK